MKTGLSGFSGLAASIPTWPQQMVRSHMEVSCNRKGHKGEKFASCRKATGKELSKAGFPHGTNVGFASVVHRRTNVKFTHGCNWPNGDICWLIPFGGTMSLRTSEETASTTVVRELFCQETRWGVINLMRESSNILNLLVTDISHSFSDQQLKKNLQSTLNPHRGKIHPCEGETKRIAILC